LKLARPEAAVEDALELLDHYVHHIVQDPSPAPTTPKHLSAAAISEAKWWLLPIFGESIQERMSEDQELAKWVSKCTQTAHATLDGTPACFSGADAQQLVEFGLARFIHKSHSLGDARQGADAVIDEPVVIRAALCLCQKAGILFS